ncbi:EamA family transporter [Clostridium tyrobutyricum]|jgi:drug/metabolite transporter (DMT)-like permease|uniref:Permease of the drug/metabolite transporter (DMT) superfamily n=1 Tax=Clostridium tyrobutyricum DIVETGP TaxID=1408889 RepID=W6N9A9_CLOTY|nr:DMT family transporter [Clostridium tyrobutyricum]AND83664.1 permease [Clostridium tyrobutyricum]ANP68432.1 permease [Clostridium tyrobutyricum]MBR9648904.1 DMT family transporter [Clostridium tyrobutyricum]MBV4421676.1 DMT family transporter [Clostridium tyrobutyricum]MBV4430966.1 DMT family transporter [Clostridium tyrobutyricum]
MSRKFKSDILLLCITIVWGSTFILMKNVLDSMSTFQFLSLRFITATIVLLLIFHKRIKFLNLEIIKYGCLIGLMLSGSLVFQVLGLNFTTASNSSFITSLNVLMVPIFLAIFFKRKTSLSSVIGVILAFLGMFFLSGGLNFKFTFGEFLTLLCAICVAFQIIFIDRFVKNQDPILIGIVQIAFSSIICSIIWIFTGSKHIIFSYNIFITLFVTGVLGTALAFTGQTFVQKFTSPTHTALIFTLEPVFGLLFALIIPGSNGTVEILTFSKVIGCSLILVGTIISELNLIKLSK